MTERSPSCLTTPGIVAAALVLASLGIAACFSERATANQTLGTTTCSAPSSTAGSTVIFIRSFTFQPASVHVKSGGSVAWVNCEPTNIEHTSTADGGAWDSGSLAPTAAFVRTFPTAGSFPYHCDTHPSMTATVIVD